MTSEAGGRDDVAPAFAGLATRTLAFSIDAAVINTAAWVVGAIVALGLSLLSIPDEIRTLMAAIGATLALAWTIAYFVFFWSANGQTPGNRLLGITVRDGRSGEPLSARRAALRVLCLPLSAIPLCAGFLLILVDPRRRALHDRLVRSVVLYTPDRARARRAATAAAKAEPPARSIEIAALSDRPVPR